MSTRDDLGPEANEARRKFWEMCASHEPTLVFDSQGNFCWKESPAEIASWADAMLEEWDKRWITPEPNGEKAARQTEWVDDDMQCEYRIVEEDESAEEIPQVRLGTSRQCVVRRSRIGTAR